MLKVWPAPPPFTRADARVDGREMGLLQLLTGDGKRNHWRCAPASPWVEAVAALPAPERLQARVEIASDLSYDTAASFCHWED